MPLSTLQYGRSLSSRLQRVTIEALGPAQTPGSRLTAHAFKPYQVIRDLQQATVITSSPELEHTAVVLQKGIRRNLLAALALVPVIAWTNGEWSRHDEDPASEDPEASGDEAVGSSGITKQGHLAFDKQRALDYDQDGSWNPFRESQKGRLPVLRYTGYLYMTVSERLGPLLVTNALEDKDLLVFYRILGGPLLVLIEHSIPVDFTDVWQLVDYLSVPGWDAALRPSSAPLSRAASSMCGVPKKRAAVSVPAEAVV